MNRNDHREGEKGGREEGGERESKQKIYKVQEFWIYILGVNSSVVSIL